MRVRHCVRSRALPALVALVAAAVLTMVAGPQPAALGYVSRGDAALVAEVRSLVGGTDAREAGVAAGFRSLAVGLVDGERTTYAFVGDRGDGRAPDTSTTFEVASVTKTFTALLLADAVQRGEVALDDPIEGLLPELEGSEAGEVTLEELATHRSGLPAYADVVSGAAYEGFGAADLAVEDEAAVIGQTLALRLSGRGTWQYSNLGVSLLGFGLARAAREASWESLVHRRILDPLGMTATTFARTAADVPASAAQGHRSNGTRVLPVTGAGYLPAGTTTFTTVADMTAYAGAILSGRAPGLTALEPRYDLGGNEQIGLVWYSRPSGGHTVWWHDGGVPGFSSVLVVDRVAGRAVVVLGGSEQGVDAVGFHLLDPHSPVTWFGSGLVSTLVGAAGFAVVVGAVVVGFRSRRPLRLVAAGLAAQGGLLLALRHGPWHQLPPWAWGLTAALVFWGTVEAGRRWGGLTRSRRDDVAGVVASAIALAAYGLVIWLG